MKNLSVALNVVLLVLVGILFYMVLSLKKSVQGGDTSYHSSKAGGLRIAYINADSLDGTYLLMKQYKNDLQTKQADLQTEYENKGRKLQAEYEEFQKKSQTGDISPAESERMQKDMAAKKNELDELQQSQSDLVKEAQDRNAEVEKKVMQYVNNYNKKTNFDYILTYSGNGGPVLFANDSLDISKPIINGLNAMYNDSIQKASTRAKR